MSKIYYSTLSKLSSNKEFYYIDLPVHICEQIEFVNGANFYYSFNKLETSDTDRFILQFFPNEKEKLNNIFTINIILGNRAGTTADVIGLLSSKNINIEYCRAIDAMYKMNESMITLEVDASGFLIESKNDEEKVNKMLQIEEEFKLLGISDIVIKNSDGKFLDIKQCFKSEIIPTKTTQVHWDNGAENFIIDEAKTTNGNYDKAFNIYFHKKGGHDTYIYKTNDKFNRIILKNDICARLKVGMQIEVSKNSIIPQFIFTSIIVDNDNRSIDVFFKDSKELIVSYTVTIQNEKTLLSHLLFRLHTRKVNLRIIEPKSIGSDYMQFLIAGDISNSLYKDYSVKTLEKLIVGDLVFNDFYNEIIEIERKYFDKFQNGLKEKEDEDYQATSEKIIEFSNVLKEIHNDKMKNVNYYESFLLKSNPELLMLCARMINDCFNLLTFSIFEPIKVGMGVKLRNLFNAALELEPEFVISSDIEHILEKFNYKKNGDIFDFEDYSKSDIIKTLTTLIVDDENAITKSIFHVYEKMFSNEVIQHDYSLDVKGYFFKIQFENFFNIMLVYSMKKPSKFLFLTFTGKHDDAGLIKATRDFFSDDRYSQTLSSSKEEDPKVLSLFLSYLINTTKPPIDEIAPNKETFVTPTLKG